MKLTLEQYFGKYLHHKDVTPERRANAEKLVDTVNRLYDIMVAAGVVFKSNPLTGSIVGGETLGGFRPQDCPIGAPASAHKQGLAVDLYDPDGTIDSWLVSHQLALKPYGLFFEHPTATPRWSHWTIRAPKSGRRFFYP
jgi:hypothetical protein